MKRKGKVSMEKAEQIKIMSEHGRSIRTISRCLKMSRKTVRKYLGTHGEVQDKTPIVTEQVEIPKLKIDDEELPFWTQGIDIDYVLTELRKGITYKILHSELKPEIGYYSFWRFFRNIFSSKKQNICMRLTHKPGEKAFVDFCDGIDIINDLTGEVIKTHLFVATLPFSQYTFAEFCFDQKLETFIEMHEKSWRFFGGVPEYTVPDNLKSGVTKAHRYDPDCNKAFCDYANYAGFAVLPARPVTPRDKASVEGNIFHIQRAFFQKVRHKKYFYLVDLNRDLKEFIIEFNNNIMKDYGVSRKERFSTEEPLLRPLPTEEFHLYQWKKAKVHPDCHIQVEKNFYSVPYIYVGKEIRVRHSKRFLEAFNNQGELIANHKILKGLGKTSTNPEHWPKGKQEYLSFDINKAKSEAKKIGENTFALIDFLFAQQHPLRYLRPVQGMLRLIYSNKFKKEDMEYATKMAMAHRIYRLSYITDCCTFHAQGGTKPRSSSAPIRDPQTMHLHNAVVNN